MDGRVFEAALESSDEISSDSDDDEGEWNGPRLHPNRSQQIMGQVRQCAENLHRERLSQRAAREANQELMDQDTVRNSPGSDSLTGTFSSDSTEEAAGDLPRADLYQGRGEGDVQDVIDLTVDSETSSESSLSGESNTGSTSHACVTQDGQIAPILPRL